MARRVTRIETDTMHRRHDHPLAVAPMMSCTDRHARYLLRLISRHVLLHTEMVTAEALVRGDPVRWLAHHPSEHPLALQVGGADPGVLARCARLGAVYGYDEINLNVGCPSDRVQSGRFGACLMAEPRRVADCVAAMRAAVSIPVTVKTRIGIDDHDDYDFLARFVDAVAAAGCDGFIVHARKAWLAGLSPKANREIPPLRHERVHRLKRERPDLRIVINGGIRTLAEARRQLAHVDGVMIGREAYHNPYLLAEADGLLYGDVRRAPSRHEVLERYLPYVEAERTRGTPLAPMARHLLGLFQGRPGARAWRRHLSEHGHRRGAGPEVLREAARRVRPDPAHAPSAA